MVGVVVCSDKSGKKRQVGLLCLAAAALPRRLSFSLPALVFYEPSLLL